MALANPPIMVNGGDTDDQRVFHPAAAFRRANYARGGDQTGITGPDSLGVVAGETPGPFVNVMPGSGVVTYAQGRGPSQDLAYAQAPNQSVDVYNDALTEVPVQPTSSAGPRTDLVVVEVVDPEMDGTRDTTDFTTHQFQRFRVIQGVGNTVQYPHQLGSLGRPVLPLARIRIPASTQTITNEMITDVRHMAQSKSAVQPLFMQLTTTGDYLDIGPNQTDWLTLGTFQDLHVPIWATRAHIDIDFGPLFPTNGRVLGYFRSVLTGQNSSQATSMTSFVEDSSTGGLNRFNPMTGGTPAISWRTGGATASLAVQIRRWSGTPGAGTIRIPGGGGSHAIIKGSITYEEHATYTREAGI